MTPAEARAALKTQLKRDEGAGLTKGGNFMPYKCPAGKLTLGYGHNLDANGITPRMAEYILDADIDTAISEVLTRWPWAETLDPARQAVLVNMLFNMGGAKLNGFRKFLAAAQAKSYEEAAVEMLASNWAEQVGDRALRLAQQMRTGEFV